MCANHRYVGFLYVSALLLGFYFLLLYRDDTVTLGSLCLGTKNTRGRVRKRSYFAADVTRSPEKYQAVSHFTLRSRT